LINRFGPLASASEKAGRRRRKESRICHRPRGLRRLNAIDGFGKFCRFFQSRQRIGRPREEVL